MSIRATIIAAQLLMAAAAALMLLVSLVEHDRSRQAWAHWRASTEQLYELVTLARRSNLYGEQLAELLLLGPAGLDRLAAVRAEVQASLDTLHREIRIVRRLPAAPVEVLGDPQWLKRALTIALDNSVKYSPRGGEVEVELKRGGGGMAELTVRDGGLGIAADEIPRAFDRFYRGRDPRIRASRGSGLGLPIAKWVTDEHGGVIDLKSDPGRTTELMIRVPVATDG